MATTPTVPGGSNTFIPSVEATNSLMVDFSKNPSRFGIARYTQYTPINQPKGRYMRMTVEESGRMVGDNPEQEHYWGDGNDAPLFNEGRESFGFYDVDTHRYAYGFNVGQIAVDNAAFNILASFAAKKAQQAMTFRTNKVISTLGTSGNWPTGHYYSAPTSIPGSGVTGALDLSTTNRKDIRRTLDAMADQIRKATLDSVTADQLHVIVSPTWARKISVCQEIVDHIKQSPAARDELENGLASNTRFGLPSRLYGYNIEVETTVKVTSRKGATKATSNVMSDGDLFMVSRPGALEGVEGAPSFSTVQVFLYEDMTVEEKYDADNRRHVGRIVDHYGVEITAPISGFYCAGTLSS